MYIQFVIAGLKISLHLTPFRLLDLILAIIKKEKFYVLNIGVCQIANQNFPIIWLVVWYSPISGILSLFFKFRMKNHLYNYGTQINDK